MTSPKVRNARQKRNRGINESIVSNKTKDHEAKAVQVANAQPAIWRDTDLTNTDYWMCKR